MMLSKTYFDKSIEVQPSDPLVGILPQIQGFLESVVPVEIHLLPGAEHDGVEGTLPFFFPKTPGTVVFLFFVLIDNQNALVPKH